MPTIFDFPAINLDSLELYLEYLHYQAALINKAKMNQIVILSVLCALLVSPTFSAPTEAPAGQASGETTTQALNPPTTVPPALSTATPVEPNTSSAPKPDASSVDGNTTASMAVSSAHDQMLNTSSFTCYGRSIGYYADPEHECKVYHFCLLGEYNGEQVYQRISYLCLNETVFDQQALDCVESSKLTAPCKDSPNYYDLSNSILRQAIVGNQMHQPNETDTTKPTTPAPVEAETPK